MRTSSSILIAALVAAIPLSLLSKQALAQQPPAAEPPKPETPPAAAPPAAAPPAATPPAKVAPPSKADIEEGKKRFAAGNEKYKAGDKQGAVEEFKEAFRLTRNPTLLYNIGFVYDELRAEQPEAKALAANAYEKFLRDAPDNAKTAANRKLATERLVILKKEIADEDAAAAAAAAAAAQPPPPTGPTKADFKHEVVDEAGLGHPLDLTAKIPVGSGWKLTLFYRAAGEDAYTGVPMFQRYQEQVARIPAEKTRSSSVQYYIEVKDKDSQLVTTSGTAASPNIVYLEPGGVEHYYTDIGPDGPGEMLYQMPADERPDYKAGVANGGGGGGGGPRDTTSRFGTMFWTATAVSVATIGMAAGFIIEYSTAKNNADALATEAHNSMFGCAEPPCHSFSGVQRSYQDDGKRAETWANVFLVGTGVAAVATGVLWWMYFRADHSPAVDKAPAKSDEARRGTIFATPVVTGDFIGGSAVIQF